MKTSIYALFMTSFISAIATGQQLYELVVPDTAVSSRADRTDERLRIEDSRGNTTVYQRARSYDSPDGSLLAYSSSAARQVIRWPVNDQGRLQIATISSGSPVEFRLSRMEIRPVAAPARPGMTTIENIKPDAAYRIVPEVPEAAGSALATNSAGRLVLAEMADEDAQVWHLNPVAPGVFRIHSDARGRGWSLASVPENAPRLVPTSNSTDQLWHFVAAPGDPSRFALASLRTAPAPAVLTWTDGLGCAMRPRVWSPNQMWRVVHLNRGLPPVFGEYVFSSRQIQPNPPLQAANVEFTNSHSKELWVLLVDRAANGNTRLKIPSGGSIVISLQRDAGAMLVEYYERTVPFGGVQREEFATPIPPASRYDLSVYEVIVQSIAIDRTAKGRNKVEDVQYAPRSLGWFELPPGPDLVDGPLDVYEAAKSQQNPGGVRRLDLKQWQSQPTNPDPVESLLNKLQPNSPM